MRSGVRTFAVAILAVVTAAVPAGAGITSAGAAQAVGNGPPHLRQLPRPAHPSTTPPQYARDHVLVRFKPGTTLSQQTARVRAAGGTALRSLDSTTYAKVLTSDVAASLRKLEADPTVAWAGYDYVRHATTIPNDPFYAPTLQEPYLNLVRLPQAWGVTTGSLSQVVAVVDSGVDATAPDLAGRVLPGEQFLSGTGTGAPGGAPGAVDNTCAEPSATGHGTFVASVAAADTNNGYGLAGAAWNAKILPVRVLNPCGLGYDSDISAGINWAADHGATVINLSLAGTDPSPVIQTAMQYATGKSIPVVVSAGNDGNSVPQYPAAYPEAISVGATDATGQLTYFSSFGDWVDLVAPGWDIVGEEPRALCVDPADPHPTDCFYVGAGTSFSAPLVSGVTALLRTKFPSWTPAQIRTRLEQTALDGPTGLGEPTGLDPYYGYGVLDAYAALGGPLVEKAGAPWAHYDEPARASFWTPPVRDSFYGPGRSDWYSYPNPSDAATTVSAVPVPLDSGVSRASLPAQLSLVVRVYDSTRHLLGSSAPVADGASASVTVPLPAGDDLIEVANANGSSPGYEQSFTLSVTNDGAGTVGAPGPLNWVEDMKPQDQDSSGGLPTESVHPTITFDRAMDPSTLTSGSVVLRNGRTGSVVPAAVSYDAPTKVLTVVPVDPLVEGTGYELAVNSGSPAAPAEDTSSNVMPETLNWFAVGPYQPPAVANLQAAGSPWGAGLSWTQPVNGDFSYVVIRYAAGTAPPTATTGTIGNFGSLDAGTVTGLLAGHDYAFSVFSYSMDGSLSAATSIVLAGSTTTLTSSPASPLYRQPTTITATVRTTDAQPAPGRTVLLYSRRTGTVPWTAIGSATTNASGQVSVSQTPPYNMQYYAVDVGGTARMGSTAMLSVPVRFAVTSSAIPATAKVGQTVRFGGVVAPARPGGRVLLEGMWSGVWHLLGYGTLTSQSSYSFAVVPTRRSTYVYRVYKEADSLLSAGAAASYSIVVT